jgi:cytochrome P450
VDASEAMAAVAEMAEFFTSLIGERRESPGSDLISAVAAGPQAPSDQEVLVFCFTLLVAGNETTTNLIGNAMLALLGRPDEMHRLWAEPSLVPSAMEGALRFDPPERRLRLAYETLIERVRDVRQNGPVERQLGALRGVRRLPIAFTEVA